jgi:hypothetical protein
MSWALRGVLCRPQSQVGLKKGLFPLHERAVCPIIVVRLYYGIGTIRVQPAWVLLKRS